MKKIFFPAIYAVCISPALATNVQPYIGLNVGASYIDWNNDLQDMTDELNVDLAEANINVGAEAGIRFATTNVWNGAVVVSYDYLFDSEADNDNIYINEITSGFSALSIGMDNYIRLGHAKKRNDLILGVGIAQITERFKFDSDYFYDKGSDSGGAAMLKIGFNRQFTENTDWYVATKFFVPFNNESDTDVIITFAGGFKFHF